MNLTIANNGNAPTGPFMVKGYQNSKSAPGGAALFTRSVNGLAPGETYSTSVPVTAGNYCAIHAYCYFVVMADADYQVTESDEVNNKRTISSYRQR